MYLFNTVLAAGDRQLFLITSSSLFLTSSSIFFEASSFELFTRGLLVLIAIVWLVWILGRNCNADAEGSSVRTMKPSSGDCRGSRAKVGGGWCAIREFRRVEGGGSSGGTIEVVGGGGCEKIKFRRVEGGGSNGGTKKMITV